MIIPVSLLSSLLTFSSVETVRCSTWDRLEDYYYCSGNIRSTLSLTLTLSSRVSLMVCWSSPVLLVVLAVLVRGETRQCTNTEMSRLWSRLLDPAVICQPRLVTVALSDPEVAGQPGGHTHSLLAPTHLQVRRCGGSCSHSHSLHSCLPTKVSQLEVEVMLSPVVAGVAGVQQSVCGRVTVEQHEECGCGCETTPAHCNSNQTFLPLECRCSCTNREARLSCISAGRHWDPSLCLCLCPGRPYPTCPNGYIYDYLETCACTHTQLEAATQLEFVFVLLLVSLLCGVTSLTQCYRSKIGLFRQTRPGLGVRQHVKTLQEEEDIELLSIKKDDG